MGPSEIETTVGEWLEVAGTVILDHRSVEARESSIIVLGYLCSYKISKVVRPEVGYCAYLSIGTCYDHLGKCHSKQDHLQEHLEQDISALHRLKARYKP